MGAAPVRGVDHPAVGGVLVGAHAERGVQRAGDRQVEAAQPAGRRCRPCRLGVRPELAVVPALRRLRAALRAQHPPAAKANLVGEVVDLRVAVGDVAGHETVVVGMRREQVPGAEVADADASLPRQPVRGHQRVRPRQQGRLAHGHVIGFRRGRQHDGPLPAAVAGQRRSEPVGRRELVPRGDPEVLTDCGLPDVGQRRPGDIDGVDQCSGTRRYRTHVHASHFAASPNPPRPTG